MIYRAWKTGARLIYSRRGGACFVPHIALVQIFSRSALRSGLNLIMTQGFSPRAKISFTPGLPAGVVALNEAVDMYFDDVQADILTLMNELLLRNTEDHDLHEHANKFFGESLFRMSDDEWLRIIISEPA